MLEPTVGTVRNEHAMYLCSFLMSILHYYISHFNLEIVKIFLKCHQRRKVVRIFCDFTGRHIITHIINATV